MELSEIMRFIFALLFVVGLIAACAWGARRFGLVPTGARASLNRRLAVSETLTIDPKRKLVIIRHDDREHLVLLGDKDLVLDTGLPARFDMEETPAGENPDIVGPLSPHSLTGPVAGQMQKVVTLLKERRA